MVTTAYIHPVPEPNEPKTGQRVSNEYVRGLLQGAVSQGCDPVAILRKAGISPACYDDPNASIDGKQLLRLLLTLEQETQDVFMGFLQQPSKAGMQVTHIKLWVQSKTLGEAIRSSTQLREQLRNDVHYDYIDDEQHHTFMLGVTGYELKPDIDPFLFYWHRLTQIYRSYCWLVGKRIKLSCVGFAMPEPPDHGDLHNIFHCDVLFDQSTNYLCFDKTYLHAPIVRTEAELLQGDIYKNYPDWFTVPGYDHSWSRQVEDALIRLHQEAGGTASLAEVACVLKVSARSLRRQLLLENESFQGIKDRVRFNLATRILLDTDTPVTQIGSLVGYAEPGSFTRAFIGWAGCTPSDYRKQHRGS